MVIPMNFWMISLLSTALSLLPLTSMQAGTCTHPCGEAPLQFPPGSYVEVEVVNWTANVVEIQESEGSDAIALPSGRSIRFYRLGTTIENSSIVFWDILGLSLRATLKKPEDDLLRIELMPFYDPENPLGDRSVYLRDDGQLQVF